LLAFAEPGRFTPEFTEGLSSALTGDFSRRTKSGSRLLKTGASAESTAHTTTRGTASRTEDEGQLFEETMVLLLQGLLADPEVLVIDRLFERLPQHASEPLIKAVLAWQSGGPEAVLGRAAPGVRLPKGAPSWMCREGGVHRTLIWRMSSQTQQIVSQFPNCAPWRIDCDGPIISVMDPAGQVDVTDVDGSLPSAAGTSCSQEKQQQAATPTTEAVLLPGVPQTGDSDDGEESC